MAATTMTKKTTAKKATAAKKAPAQKEILVGEGQSFEKIRRITGYLVGSIDRWNNAKRAEEKDRVKHSMAH